jgi:hypothetical protein
MKFQVNQVYLKQAKIIQDVMSMHYQKKKLQKIILVTTIFGGLSVFMPINSLRAKHENSKASTTLNRLYKMIFNQ